MPPPAQAQPQCGSAESLAFPVDTNTFHIVNDFGAPSPRHFGAYHTGEDWYGGRNASLGQPVRAIANGRVTASAPNGWGRDGGVIILEHTFPDGGIAFSMYGHIAQTETRPFPQLLGCVQLGEIIASVGDARPAPHLHFEIREGVPTSAGPGYLDGDLFAAGYRHPSQFVRNWQTWLQPYHAWHTISADAGNLPAPLELSDHSLLYVDGTRVQRALNDGRVLWRTILDQPAAAILRVNNLPTLLYADGGLQPIEVDGALGQRQATAFNFGGAPFVIGDTLLFPNADGALVALSPNLDSVRWRLSTVSDIIRAHETPQITGLLTHENHLLIVSSAGDLLDESRLRGAASMATAENGDLLVYSRGGLWNVDSTGTWSLLLDDAPSGGESSALLRLDNGGLLLFDGATLHAYDRDLNLLWRAPTPPVDGLTELRLVGSTLLLTSSHGHIIALRASNGGLCNTAQIYGEGSAPMWISPGDDGVLRVALANQLLGINWQRFLGGCA